MMANFISSQSTTILFVGHPLILAPCSLGSDTLPMMRGEIDQYVKEMKDWEEETLKVMPSSRGSASRVDQFVDGK
jgi:hypothetical protein